MTASCRSSSQSTPAREQLVAYLDRLFSDREGIVAVAVGSGGHYNERGKYRVRGMQHKYFTWPRQREDVIDVALRSAQRYDVYVIPNLRTARSAKNGCCLGSYYCWADIDDVTDATLGRLQSVLSLGSFIVHSGHGLHVYIRLDGFYSPEVVVDLNKQLTTFLPADSKWNDCALLRLPGCFNHKGRAAGVGSLSVSLEETTEATCIPWKPEDLVAVMRDVGPRSGSRAPRQRKPRPPQTPRKAISPVEPAPLPDDLPQEILDLLGGWEKTKGRQDRSAHLHRLIALLVRTGYSDGEVMAVALLDEQAQDKWEDEDDLRREIQRSIDVLRLGDEVDEQIRAVRQHFRQHYRSRQTQATDAKVFDAALKVAEQAHRIEFDLSTRSLAEMAGISKNTVAPALARLAHYITKCRSRRVRKLPKHRQASRYRLRVPGERVGTYEHRDEGGRGNNSIQGEYVPTPSILDPSLDIWRYLGLGACRFTYELLIQRGAATVPDLANTMGKTPRTIRDHLKRLKTYGLAERKPNGEWVAFDRPADEVAKEMGTLGTGKRQSQRHRFERQAFDQYLEHRKQMEKQNIQDLIDAGYVWGGPNDAVLMRPEF